jgi:hypothetical protein
MSTKIYSYASEIWWPDIERLANTFVNYINKDGKHIKLDKKKILSVKSAYFRNMSAFKKLTYKEKPEKHKIDRHKIIALYIKSILEISPFVIDDVKGSEKTPTLIVMLANEYFSMLLMETIIIAWNTENNILNISEHEKKWFIILLNHFRLHPNTLDILSLSQIIYYIEKNTK